MTRALQRHLYTSKDKNNTRSCRARVTHSEAAAFLGGWTANCHRRWDYRCVPAQARCEHAWPHSDRILKSTNLLQLLIFHLHLLRLPWFASCWLEWTSSKSYF